MKKRKKWGGEKSIIQLKPGWKEEMIEAFTKYDMPYKKRIKDMEKAIRTGEAVVV